MSVVPSLLQAIVAVDGDAMVIHAGEKPYVVAPSGQMDLASRGLTLDAVNGIVNQLLPVELQNALEEFGAVQYELPASSAFPRQHFTVVAARGGDDLWVEVRRRRVPDDDDVPEEFFAPSARQEVDATASEPIVHAALAPPAPAMLSAITAQERLPADMSISSPEAADRQEPAADHDIVDDDLSLPDAAQLFKSDDLTASPEAMTEPAIAPVETVASLEPTTRHEPVIALAAIASPPALNPDHSPPAASTQHQ